MQTHERKRLKTAACRYAFTGLALNYYSQYEILGDQLEMTEPFCGDLKEFHKILGQFLEGKTPIQELSQLRSRVIGRMEILTAYVDCFQIYEYVLNRMEFRFQEERTGGEEIHHFVDQLMEYLDASGDTAIFNSRIQEVERQLPIRYTKQKFYSLLSDRLTLYAGADRGNVEDVFYMLRTSSMALLPEGMKEAHETLFGLLSQLRSGNYRNMTEEEWNGLQDVLYQGSEILNRESGDYLLLEEMINELYAVLLSMDEALWDAEEKKVLYQVTKEIWSLFMQEEYREPGDEVTALLEKLEGIQESAFERLDFPEDGEEEVQKLSVLLSGSAFVRLDEEKKEERLSGPADREWLMERSEAFCRELDQLFSDLPKTVIRAIMANLLSYLPVVFESREALRDHMVNRLESCSDPAEQAACMELLRRELMEEDAFY